jgi:short-subunit dehydrogenase
MLPCLERLLPLWWRRPLAGIVYADGPFAGLKPITIVTGGSEGVGLALSHRFAAHGHALLIIARSAERLCAAADEVRARHAVEVTTLVLDVTRADACDEIDAALARAGGYAHILINDAGVGLAGAFAEHSQQKLAALVDLNVRALSLLMHHVLPGMRQRGRGGVINLSSMGGLVPGPWQAAYYASKAYVLSLSQAVAAEVVRDGVRICAVAPGPVDTGFHGRMHSERAFYRLLLPPLQADTVARWAYYGFKLGLRVIVPDFVNAMMSLFLRFAPRRIAIPIVAWLLRPRGQESGDA